jgi:hypothetical protein
MENESSAVAAQEEKGRNGAARDFDPSVVVFACRH